MNESIRHQKYMELTPLTLIAPKIQLSEIFPALELMMSHQALKEAIAES